MKKHDFLFDGSLRTWETDLLDFELKDGVDPVCLRPYPLQKVHVVMFKKEVEHLMGIWFLKLSTTPSG